MPGESFFSRRIEAQDTGATHDARIFTGSAPACGGRDGGRGNSRQQEFQQTHGLSSR